MRTPADAVDGRDVVFDSQSHFAGHRGHARRGYRTPTGATRTAASLFSTLETLKTWTDAKGRHLALATNAGGIYDREFKPLGLYVEDGKTIVPLSNPVHGNPRSGNFLAAAQWRIRRVRGRKRGSAHERGLPCRRPETGAGPRSPVPCW